MGPGTAENLAAARARSLTMACISCHILGARLYFVGREPIRAPEHGELRTTNLGTPDFGRIPERPSLRALGRCSMGQHVRHSARRHSASFLHGRVFFAPGRSLLARSREIGHLVDATSQRRGLELHQSSCFAFVFLVLTVLCSKSGARAASVRASVAQAAPTPRPSARAACGGGARAAPSSHAVSEVRSRGEPCQTSNSSGRGEFSRNSETRTHGRIERSDRHGPACEGRSQTPPRFGWTPTRSSPEAWTGSSTSLGCGRSGTTGCAKATGPTCAPASCRCSQTRLGAMLACSQGAVCPSDRFSDRPSVGLHVHPPDRPLCGQSAGAVVALLCFRIGAAGALCAPARQNIGGLAC